MVKCHAKNRAGGPCGHYAAHGQQVCHMHGAKAPQALRKAEERMHDLVHPALSSLARLISDDEFAATKYVLDWAGFKAKVELEADHQITINVVRKSGGPALEHGRTNGHTA